MREFLTGNDAIVRAAVSAGCDFFAGYPITPASSILTGMIEAFSGTSATAVQTEDEIAAIGQCIGAAMAGARAMTATSGPGLSLYSENIGLAQMGEVPLVIVDCQRMGPATGGATATGDGDVCFARHVTAGGYPLPVFAAADAASAYRLTARAFGVAERLRTPVIVLSSKDIALTRQTVDLDEVPLPARIDRAPAPTTERYRPYAIRKLEDVPPFAPIGGAARVRFTGSIHDEDGLLTIDHRRIEQKLAHLNVKVRAAANWLEDANEDIDPQAAVLIVGYGQVDGAVRDAVDILRAEEVPVSRLTLYSLWPLPAAALQRAVTPCVRRVVVPELNVGLYADELRRVTRAVVESLTRYDGRPIGPADIVRHVVGRPCG
jgi:2-oxoglutarate ferredoxin oxidoreductase subunit alpha